LYALAELEFGQVFYQLVSNSMEGMLGEAEFVANILENSLVLKIPPTEIGFRFVSKFENQYVCCITAIYGPTQALVAHEAGARYIAVYVNRATRLMGDGLEMVQQISEILKNSKTEILAASLKTKEEACGAIVAGAQHLTLPIQVLMSLIEHPLSKQAVDEFLTSGIGVDTKP